MYGPSLPESQKTEQTAILHHCQKDVISVRKRKETPLSFKQRTGAEPSMLASTVRYSMHERTSQLQSALRTYLDFDNHVSVHEIQLTTPSGTYTKPISI